MEVETEAPSTEISWRYDTESSWVLRVVAHGFIAAFGGLLLFTFAVLLLALPETLSALTVETIALIVLLIFVGGPFSLVYLWPMITDPDQRPNASAFAAEGGTVPWTKRSSAVAIVIGTAVLRGLLALDPSFDCLFTVLVLAIFSPIVVSLFTTDGTISDEFLVSNGNQVALRQITGIRSLHVGTAVVLWLTFASGTGFLTPRLVTVPEDLASDVMAKLEQGKQLEPGQQ